MGMADALIKRNRELKARKDPWLPHYQLLGEYIHQRKQDFTADHMQGDFLTRDTFNNSGSRAAKISASSLVSRIWPQTDGRFRLKGPKRLEENEFNKKYFESMTDVVIEVMDDPEGGLQNSWHEYMLDEVVFGTAGIEPEKVTDPDSDVRIVYRPWGVLHMTIAEGRRGIVEEIHLNLEKRVSELVDEYGIENVSSKVKKMFDKQEFDTKIPILIAIAPRDLGVIPAGKATKGKLAMPFRSIHIEVGTRKLLREGGFEEMNIKIGRMTKIMKETYGRSFGMDALQDILQANAVWESISIATEKNLDPPLWIIDDGRLGGGVLDTSAGALNVFNVSGRAGSDSPVNPLFTVGEMVSADKLLERLDRSIAEHFAIDRLLDFNNTTRMTLGEAQIRDKNRNETLGSVMGRQITDMATPLIKTSVNMLFDDGHLGFPAADEEGIQAYRERFFREPLIIPDDVVEIMASGQSFYDIEYATPAMRILNSEKADSILRTWEEAGVIAALAPSVVDHLDEGVSIRLLSDFNGAPSEIKRAIGRVKEIQDAAAALAKEERDAAALSQGSEAARNLGQSGLVPTQQPQLQGA